MLIGSSTLSTCVKIGYCDGSAKGDVKLVDVKLKLPSAVCPTQKCKNRIESKQNEYCRVQLGANQLVITNHHTVLSKH